MKVQVKKSGKVVKLSRFSVLQKVFEGCEFSSKKGVLRGLESSNNVMVLCVVDQERGKKSE